MKHLAAMIIISAICFCAITVILVVGAKTYFLHLTGDGV